MHNKTKTNIEPPQTTGEETMNYQQQNHRLRPDSSLSHRMCVWGGGGGLWWGKGGKMHFTGAKIIDLDYVTVNAQIMLSSHGGFLAYAMHHHR